MGEHDALFKRAFAVPEHAAGELRSVLPAALLDALDLDRLEHVPGSFVDPKLRDRHTDLLFRAPLRGDPEVSAYVYVVLEHQSSPDEIMPLRMLSYCSDVWRRIARNPSNDAASGRVRLPILLPLVIHHGPMGWTAARSLHAMVDGLDRFPELARYVPNVELIVDDLVRVGNTELSARPLGPMPMLTLLLLRDGRAPMRVLVALAAFRDAIEGLLAGDQGDVEAILRYLLVVTGEVPFEALRAHLAEVSAKLEETMVSHADQFFERGMQKGMERGMERGMKHGMERGIDQGRLETLRGTLRRLLSHRFGGLTSEAEARIAGATAGDLERCLDRVLTAESVEAVFA